MIQCNDHRTLTHWGRMALASIAAALLLTGCGGGGGGGSSSGGSSSSQTATITGQLIDKTTSNVLPNRTVTVENTTLSAVTNAQGGFTISSVPVTSVTLSVTDSNGTSDGTGGPFDLTKISGSTKSVGTITLNIYGSGGGPPAPPV